MLKEAVSEAKRSPLPVQEELELFNRMGKPSNAPCEAIAAHLQSLTNKQLTPAQQSLVKLVAPGLDASLCKCPKCLKKAANGVWWYDSEMRDRVLSRRMPDYPMLSRENSSGDLCRDKEEKTS